MTLLYQDPRFLYHETGAHPERANRIRGIPERLEKSGLQYKCRKVDWDRVSRERLARIHSPTYVHEVWALAKSGGGDIDGDTIVGPGSFDVARLAAGSVCDAVERLFRGEDHRALCLVRPPGHHALPARAMGFCLFNNVAVAARMATDELGLERILIVDWDIHHGNGTQDAFWEDPSVGFFSIHRWPFYPGTGRKDETGTGDALGTIRNLPVSFGIPREGYLKQFGAALEEFAEKIKPQLVLISAGFDSHRLDPVGNLGLETEDFGELTRMVLDVADTHCGGKIVSVLEGGYNPAVLTDCIEVHLDEIVKRAEK